jgi:Uma2 family endonuclease
VSTQLALLHRFTVEDVLAMVAAGILHEDDRVELIDGVLVEMSPTGPRHSGVVEWLNAHLVKASGDAFRVRVHDTFVTPGGGFFEPDLFAIEPIPRTRMADRALLVVEVAYTSRQHDLWKTATYAAAGIPEYWIVDVDPQRGARPSRPRAPRATPASSASSRATSSRRCSTCRGSDVSTLLAP